MTTLFYVLYSPSKKQYVQKDQEGIVLGSFEGAVQIPSSYDARYDLGHLEDSFDIGDLRVVGPCMEGEEP